VATLAFVVEWIAYSTLEARSMFKLVVPPAVRVVERNNLSR